MTKRIPKHIASQYEDGAHGFRSEKRRLIREILKRISDLRLGCFYFPSETDDVAMLDDAAERIKADLSVKNWGR